MDEDEIQIDKKNNEESSLWQRFLHLIGLKSILHARKIQKTHKRYLEPKYWPEVKHFLDSITQIIQTHTIDDNNIRIINQRILDYVADQINVKGSIENIEERYLALDTLADRILVNNLGKIVGLKKTDDSKPEFSNAVADFKKQLHERHQQEIVKLNLDKH